MKKQVKRYYIILYLFFASWLVQAESILNFDYRIKQLRYADNKDTSLFAGMNHQSKRYFLVAEKSAGQHTIMSVWDDSGVVEPLVPEKISLNGSRQKLNNPLHGEEVSLFSFDGANNPVIAMKNSNKLFLMPDSRAHNVSLLMSDELKDAQKKPVGAICALDALGTDFIVAAVTPYAEQKFGGVGSGIALLRNEVAPKIGSRVPQRLLKQLNAQSGGYIDPCAVLLDGSDKSVAIGQPLFCMEDAIDFCVDENVFLLPGGKQQIERRLYIALQTTSADDPASGARSLLMGFYTPMGQLLLKPVVHETAFDAVSNGKIVGAKGALQSTSLHKIRILKTAFDSLRYLIVLGGNGLPHETRRSVFALPLVYDLSYDKEKNIYDINAHAHGMLADVTIKKDEQAYKNAATESSHLYSSDSRPAMVGAGPLQAGDIVDIYTQGTAVFAIVEDANAGYTPGIFSSQALFDDNQTIVGWTEWQSVFGVDQSVHSAAFTVDTNYAGFVVNTSDGSSSVVHTQWSDGSDERSELAALLNRSFAKEAGGVHGLFDFSHKTPALGVMSVLVATGFKKLLFVQTGQVVDSVLKLCKTDLQSGALIFDARTDLGAISSVEIAGATNANGYLFVGGFKGLAVVTDASGRGWNVQQGAVAFFDHIEQDALIKKIGNYTSVLKIMSDGNFVYVLTDQQLDRIDLAHSNFATGKLSVVTVAHVGSLRGFGKYDCFFDLLVSEKLILLATSVGLFRNGDDTVASTMSERSAHWTQVPLRNDTGAITKLIPVSVSGRAQDVSRYGGGMVYALDANHSEQKSNALRVVVGDTVRTAIGSRTVCFSSLLKGSFGAYRKCFATDGFLFFSSCNKHAEKSAQLFESFDLGSKVVNLGVDNSAAITAVVRESSSGQWIVSGDFGVRVHN